MSMLLEREYQDRLVRIPVGDVMLEGNLNLPDAFPGIVLFAHGSGSSRKSPRNRFVAEALQAEGLGTLLMDLLTSEEEALDMRTGHLRFDIDLLSERLLVAAKWLGSHPDAQGHPLGYFGSSTGAAAALVAAARKPDSIKAVVSRGGRPDLAGNHLPKVKAPTLLIVGGRDSLVVDLNREALALLDVDKELKIIPWATHLFEEPGALEDVARLAGNWFLRHFEASQTR
ncbi:MAG: dienelactone hydrolase family protein [Desulfovibrionales bacterium]